MMITRILMLISLLGCQSLIAQLHCTPENRMRVERQMQHLEGQALATKSPGEVAIAVGMSLLGTPYVAHTLELPGEEQLVIDLAGLDCTTFLENVVVLTRLAKQQKLHFDAFTQGLKSLRYREGKLAAYPSRLHYFTDWIHDNQAKGMIKDVSQSIGGEPYQKEINFMSTHRGSYKQLANEAHWKAVQAQEAKLTTRKRHYIPKAKLAELESGIQSGDLIAITTSIAGLDVVHVGLALRQNGRIHLLHASSKGKKVEISEESLADYLMKNKSQSGVIVCRLQSP